MHRNYYYAANKKNTDNKPISIIISTLSAMAYMDCTENDLYDQFIYVVENMDNYINKENKNWTVLNPVDDLENFADKWEIYPERKHAFFEWLYKIKDDCKRLKNSVNMNEYVNIFKVMFGDVSVTSIYNDFGSKLKNKRINGDLYINGNGTLNESNKGNLVKNHTFFGDD